MKRKPVEYSVNVKTYDYNEKNARTKLNIILYLKTISQLPLKIFKG